MATEEEIAELKQRVVLLEGFIGAMMAEISKGEGVTPELIVLVSGYTQVVKTQHNGQENFNEATTTVMQKLTRERTH